MAVRTRTLIRFRSPFDMPPNTDMIRSWASLFGSIGPPTSGTHSGTSVVNEQRERVTELVAVELPLRLPDHHRLEPTVRVLQLGQQRERLRPALPRDRPAVTGIEVRRDDGTAVRFDEGLGAGELSGPGVAGGSSGARTISCLPPTGRADRTPPRPSARHLTSHTSEETRL